MLRAFARHNEERPYADQVKPFNFLLSVRVAPFGHPDGIESERFHLAAPYESDASRWLDLDWVDLHSGQRIRITTDELLGGDGVARVKTYRNVLGAYRLHPEPKSLAPDGGRCRLATRGLLGWRPVSVASIQYVGKESNRLEDVQGGLVHDEGEVLSEYRDPRRDPWWAVVRVLKGMPNGVVAEAAGIHPRTARAIRNGRAYPRAGHREALIRLASEFAEVAPCDGRRSTATSRWA